VIVFDLNEETIIGRWNHRFEDARNWKDRYPECVSREFGY